MDELREFTENGGELRIITRMLINKTPSSVHVFPQRPEGDVNKILPQNRKMSRNKCFVLINSDGGLVYPKFALCSEESKKR